MTSRRFDGVDRGRAYDVTARVRQPFRTPLKMTRDRAISTYLATDEPFTKVR
jgi:hypothetical protein